MAQRTTSDSSADEDDTDVDEDIDEDENEDEESTDEDEDEEDDKPRNRRDARIKRLSDENAKWRIRARKAGERARTLEAELEKLRSEGVDDETTKKSLAELPRLKEEIDDLREQVKTYRVGDAIRKEMDDLNLNPKRAQAILKQIDLDDIEVDEDGVTGVHEALEKVAQDFPEWVMRSQGDDDGEAANGRTSGQSSRKPGTSNRKKPTIDKAKLAAQFPALAATFRPEG
jgi:hypothetical protein